MSTAAGGQQAHQKSPGHAPPRFHVSREEKEALPDRAAWPGRGRAKESRRRKARPRTSPTNVLSKEGAASLAAAWGDRSQDPHARLVRRPLPITRARALPPSLSSRKHPCLKDNGGISTRQEITGMKILGRLRRCPRCPDTICWAKALVFQFSMTPWIFSIWTHRANECKVNRGTENYSNRLVGSARQECSG